MPDNAIQLLLNEWLLAVFNPQKRIFWGYLLSSLFIAILWLRLIQKINIQSSFIKIFNLTWTRNRSHDIESPGPVRKFSKDNIGGTDKDSKSLY